MNSLEDAFVNIGMDETAFLDKDLYQKKIEKIDEIQKMKIPASFSYPPKYDFFTQLHAIFYRKYLITTRTAQVYVSLLIPLVFQTLGLLYAYLIQTYQPSGGD